MIGMIAAVTINGVIGIQDKIPFDYPEDMKHFKNKTSNSTVIMGRKTFEDIGRPLPNRTNIIISSRKIDVEGIQVYDSLQSGILAANLRRDIWLIGGAKIYEEGMEYADQIVLTITPDIELGTPAIRFPWINPMQFELKQILPIIPASVELQVATYQKIKQQP